MESPATASDRTGMRNRSIAMPSDGGNLSPVKPVAGMADFAGGGSIANPAPTETNANEHEQERVDHAHKNHLALGAIIDSNRTRIPKLFCPVIYPLAEAVVRCPCP